MTSVNVKKYTKEDKLDKALAKEVSTYVKTAKIYDFANLLGMPKEEVDRIEKEEPFKRPTLIKGLSK